jgi:hypothetical protein
MTRRWSVDNEMESFRVSIQFVVLDGLSTVARGFAPNPTTTDGQWQGPDGTQTEPESVVEIGRRAGGSQDDEGGLTRTSDDAV